MKKVGAIITIAALLLTCFASIPVSAASPSGNIGNTGTIGTVYVDQNFDDATPGFDINDVTNLVSGSYQPINVLNYADSAHPVNLPWMTQIKDAKTIAAPWDYYYKPSVISGTNLGLVGIKKGQTPAYLKLPTPIMGTGSLVYMDMRVKRVSSTDDAVTLSIQDSSTTPKNIYTIAYTSGYFPKLTSSATYGGEASTATPTINYPIVDGGWTYMRTILNFANHTFELYRGDTMDTLAPIVSDTTTFTFNNISANDLGQINVGTKGALGFDDLKIYSVTQNAPPSANNVTLNGKPNIGAQLTGSYTYSGFGTDASEVKFEASSDTQFTNPEIISQGSTSYTVQEADSGKYIRFVVTPKNTDGATGSIVSSSALAYPINYSNTALSINGNLNNGSFDFKSTTNDYKGQVDITSTLSTPINQILIAAWYKDGVLTDVKSIPVSVDSAADSPTGIITQTITTGIVKSMPLNSDPTGLTMKVYLWNGLTNIKPIKIAENAGSSL